MGNQRHVTRATKLIDITKEFDGSLIAIVTAGDYIRMFACRVLLLIKFTRTNEKISVACG